MFPSAVTGSAAVDSQASIPPPFHDCRGIDDSSKPGETEGTIRAGCQESLEAEGTKQSNDPEILHLVLDVGSRSVEKFYEFWALNHDLTLKHTTRRLLAVQACVTVLISRSAGQAAVGTFVLP
jgi:hypothetical protein